MKAKEEYVQLREELMYWTKARINLITSVLIIIPAIIGWVVANPEFFSWMIASMIPLLVIALSSQLTRLFAENTIVIAGYLRYYCKSNYEDKLYNLKYDQTRKALNFSIAWYYFALTLISIVIPYLVCNENSRIDQSLECILFALILLFNLFSIFQLVVMNLHRLRKKYYEKWKETDKKEDI